MTSLSQFILENSFVLDAAGVIGLGFIGIAAVRLSRHEQSWGGTLMAFGAVGLLVARLYFVLRPYFLPFIAENFTGNSGRILSIVPPFLLILGLAGIVWGVWAHERGLRESRE